MPYPPNKGDKIRSFNEIKYLSKKHNLYLAFLIDNERDVIFLDELRKHCIDFDYDIIRPHWQKIKSIPYLLTNKPLSIPYFYSKKLQGAIDRRLKESQIDTIICFSSPMAEYIFKSKALDVQYQRSFSKNELDGHGYPRLIMDFVDIDSDKWRIYAELKPFPFSVIYRREWKRLMNYEKMIGCLFDQSVFVSEQEIKLFKSFCPDARAIAIENGVDFDFYNNNKQKVPDRQMRQHEPNILFMGTMDYFPNEDAVMYFSSEIWPYVKKELPQAKFYIVGGNPSKAVRLLTKKDPRIVVTGYVTDVRAYLKMADVFVAPLRIARGVQNKVLEAMAADVPVVARPEAVQGLNCSNGCIKVEENNERFAQSILKIIRVPNKGYKMVSDSKRFILKNHNWENNLEKLEKIVNERK